MCNIKNKTSEAKPNKKMKWPKQKAMHLPLGPRKTLDMHNINQKPRWKWCGKKIGRAICLTCFLKLKYIPLYKLHEGRMQIVVRLCD
jgi:hypothetical protein